MKKEIWEPIFDLYEISSIGRIRSYHDYNHNVEKHGPRYLKPHKSGAGYLAVGIHINQKCRMTYMHRLVAWAFLPNPCNKPHVAHLNGIKTDNRIENLIWATRKENESHKLQHGTLQNGEKQWKSVLKEKDVLNIRSMYKTGEYAQKYLANKYGVTRENIREIVKRRTWKHI